MPDSPSLVKPFWARPLPPVMTAATVLVGLGVASLPWVRLNLSSSLPRGLYRLHAVPATISRGMLVVVAVPAALRPWYTARAPLLKPVAGVAGDMLTIQDDHLYVNEQDYGPIYHQVAGQVLPLLVVPQQIPAGEVCLASPAPRSLDCRYFSTTPIATIRAVATPFWLWE